jgi:flagella basal body P-ring formation protein FlgA
MNFLNQSQYAERPTLENQRASTGCCWALGVGRSLIFALRILLFACLGGGFAVSLVLGEPSDSVPDNAATDTAPAVSTNAAPQTAPRQHELAEAEIVELLTAALQQDYVKDKGELELRLGRPWTTRAVPDEPIFVKLLDLPLTGVTPTCILRFELRTAHETLGTYQVTIHSRVWRDVWVARSGLKRGDVVADADIEKERRDVLAFHEPLADFAPGDSTLELSEPLQTGSPLLARSVKARPVIRRGQSADAVIRDGVLSVTMKVEALEDGAPGQIIRARNSQTRRDIRGKVLNEQTILVSL